MRLALTAFGILLLLAQPAVMAAPQQALPSEETTPQAEVFDKLQAAALQHETIVQLIDQQQYAAILPELKKIFELDLPAEYEIYQVQEIQSVVQKLRARKELAVGHAAVDLGLSSVRADRFKSTLYLLKAQLYRDNGQAREAAEAADLARKLYRDSARSTRP